MKYNKTLNGCISILFIAARIDIGGIVDHHCLNFRLATKIWKTNNLKHHFEA
jgi:hypothetical protein